MVELEVSISICGTIYYKSTVDDDYLFIQADQDWYEATEISNYGSLRLVRYSC